MGVRWLECEGEDYSVLYDSVSEWVFGPLFHGTQTAMEFLEWYDDPSTGIKRDLRELSTRELEDVYALFVREHPTD